MSQLTSHQIHSIEDKIREGYNDSQIAKYIKKDRSVISRLFREYPRDTFDAEEVVKRRFQKKSQATQSHRRIKLGGDLAEYIHEKFMLNWSPDQIVETWKLQEQQKQTEQQKPVCNYGTSETNKTHQYGGVGTGVGTGEGTQSGGGTQSSNISNISNISNTTKILDTIHLSKGTVYTWIYTTYPPEDLKVHLRRQYKSYRDRIQEAALGGKYQMGEQVSIDERAKTYPETTKRDEATGRRTEGIGHWEGDTIIGKNRSGAILTLVERTTGLTLIGELPEGKQAVGLTSVLTRLFKHIPKDKITSITFDNGREFADHKMMQHELRQYFQKDIDIYFAHPYHSWERGTNENTNGLIRQYIPKKTEFTNNNTKQKDLDKIQISLNSRPRKRLNYLTPDQVFWGS